MAENRENDRLLVTPSSSSESFEENKTTKATCYKKNIISGGLNINETPINNVESQTKPKNIKLSKKHFILLASIAVIALLTFIIIISLLLVLTVKTSQLLTQQQQQSARYEITEDNQRQVVKMGSLTNMAKNIAQNSITLPEIVLPPAATSSLTAQSITLDCKFNAEVDCYWTRNGQTVDVEDRYQYVRVPPKSDCSIRINSVDDIDFGSWQCGCHGSDRYNGVKSEAILLSKSLALIRASSNQSASLDESVVLECAFNRAVPCVWLRNGSPIEIADRYSFVQTTASNNNNNNDCSLKIKAVQKIDFAVWSCGASNQQLASSPILLSQKARAAASKSSLIINDQPAANLMINELVQEESGSVAFRKQPSSVAAKRGSSVHLDCEFAQPVTCAWLRNDQHVDIQGRYRYKVKDYNNNNDCSITINNLQANDKGEWVCSSMADSNGDGVKSQTAVITLR